jgi:hypothetical protein
LSVKSLIADDVSVLIIFITNIQKYQTALHHHH